MQVPRIVQKQTPYTYTVRSPRVVVTKVPLDACGHPLPAATSAPTAARPATPAAPALPAAEAGPVKTFSSDKPAAAPQPASGWGGSSLPHVDPEVKAEAEGAYRAEKPAGDVAAPTLRKIETIPTPAATDPAAVAPERQPTVAPTGPSVFPPPPATDARDVPAAKTSGRTGIIPTAPASGHTT